MSLRRATPGGGGETGAVSVLVALCMPFLIILVVWFVLNLGTWFEQARHLQLQADAGAVAGALQIPASCSGGSGAAGVLAVAKQYAGMTSSAYNRPVGGLPPSGVVAAFNQDLYPDGSQAIPADTTTYTGDFCTDAEVDAKLQESNVPWYLWAGGLGPTVHAHARASLLPPPAQVGVLPLGVPESDPEYGEVYYVDESSTPGNPTVIAAGKLTRNGSTWSDSGAPISVNLALAAQSATGGDRAIGIVVAFNSSSNAADPLTGNLTADCGAAASPLTACYDAGITATGGTPAVPSLLHIRTWSATATGTASAPIVRDVQLQLDSSNPPATGCTDAYFSNASATCTDDIEADVDYGAATEPAHAGVTATLSSGASTKLTYRGTGAAQFASGGACGNLNAPATPTTDECWTGTPAHSNAISVPATTGDQEVDLTVATGKSTSVSAPDVQRTYTTDSNSGPVLKATSYSAFQLSDLDSIECHQTAASGLCTVPLYASFTLLPSYQVEQQTGDEPVVLRAAGNGSQTQLLSCQTGGGSFKSQFASGCPEGYTPNLGNGICPVQSPAPQPYQCMQTATGNKNSLTAALNARFAPGGTCSPNNWATFSTETPAQQYQSTDPRKVFVLLAPLSAFSGNGNAYYPVLAIGEFYVAYYQGDLTGNGPGVSVCGGSPPASYNPSDPYYDGPLQPGDMVGYFVEKFVDVPHGNPGSGTCSLSSLNGCAIYLTQ